MHTPPPSAPPQVVLAELINGYWASFAIHAACALGVPDALGDTPVSVEELAAQVGADPDALHRLLRALAALGIFTELPEGRVAHTPLSLALRGGVPGSMRGLALMTGLLHLRVWPEIVHSVRTGETAMKKTYGHEIYAHLLANPDVGRVFDEAMAGYTAAGCAAVAGAYDFSGVDTLVDVGGGNGALLGALLPKYPALRGVNVDLPHVVARAPARDRVEHVGVDFFAAPLPAGDAYTLKHILHNWDDARSEAILRAVRRVIAPGGRIVVAEAVLPEDASGAGGKLFDLNMLVMSGGRERTEREYRALFSRTGFTLTRVVPVTPMLSLVEGVPTE